MNMSPIISKNYYFKAPFKVSLRRETISNIPSGHYLINLEACGLCHSDLLWIAHRAKNWEKIGHEFGGEIITCGNNTSKFREGQRVAIKNAAQCGACEKCMKGNYRNCKDIIVNKSGFDQFFLADERSIIDAEGLDASLLGLVEPLGVANDVVDSADIRPGDCVAIFGVGSIGLMAGWLCIQKGASVVIGIARHSGRFALAKEFGFTACFESQSANCEKSVEKVTGGLCEKILVCAPPQCLTNAIKLLHPEGLIVVGGLNEGGWDIHTPFNFETLIFKRASIRGAFAYPNLYFEPAIDQLRNYGTVLGRIISHVEPLSKLQHILRQVNSTPHTHLKTVLVP